MGYREFVIDVPKRNNPAWVPPHDLFHTSFGSSTSLLTALIHLFSFSKSFAIPGHRLGGIACSPHLLEWHGPEGTKYGPISKLLDNMQVCPPRIDVQRAVAWALSDPEHSAWRLEMAVAVRQRLELFARVMHEPVAQGGEAVGLPGKAPTTAAARGWAIESMGAYYAYVRHPFAAASSTDVAHALALLCGAVSVPSACFAPVGGDQSDEQHLRFSVANVSDELIRELPQRLVWLSMLWDEHGAGWGISRN